MHGGISRRHEMPLKSNLKVELFNVRGIDFIEPSVSSYRNKYILVDVDYVSKWVEIDDFQIMRAKYRNFC